jgi:hypothetical protein
MGRQHPLCSVTNALSQPAGTDGVTHVCAYEGPYQTSTIDQQPRQEWQEGTSIWNAASVDEPSAPLATSACFQAYPGSLETSFSASEAWNFEHSTINVNNNPLWNQPSGDDNWMNIPDRQGSMPTPTSDPFFPPALPESHFDFSLATAPPQLDPALPTIPSSGVTSTPAQRITCSFAGCGRTFARAGDCRRHMGKHAAPTFRCIFLECGELFYRKDKALDHATKGHKK